jgi:hypothetical protein
VSSQQRGAARFERPGTTRFSLVFGSFARKQGFSARARLLSAGRIACAIDIDRCGLVVPASAM